ncbi:MAG: Two component transcriptional regulator, LuxR family [Bryobacterales bacterium]|jgi:two-component system nitrate/nitrite response regulator NarL|nr:Two component transcriptional regulator, LuxR family [Bryobacterales bacterium]
MESAMPIAPTETIKLLLVDDHALFLEGMERLLAGEADFTVVGSVRSFAQAVSLLAENQVDILLLDFDLGRDRATPLVRTLAEQKFPGKILIVTAGVSEAEAVQLIRAGVAGIFHKHNGSAALCDTIRKVASGGPYLESEYLSSVFRTLGPEPESGPPSLSERDVKLLRLIFQGLVNKEIATRLEMTESGVKSALRSLFEKIGVRTRSQAVRVALESYRDQF